jgi:phosphotransferase system  glucose/maltose/N-acetylglucosamine-specific IIC component
MQTIGLSPKFIGPVIAQAAAVLATWIASGAFDRVQVAQIVTLIGTALIAYLAGPGEVFQDIGEANDDLLGADIEPG